jgi:hypothetical protein
MCVCRHYHKNTLQFDIILDDYSKNHCSQRGHFTPLNPIVAYPFTYPFYIGFEYLFLQIQYVILHLTGHKTVNTPPAKTGGIG